MARATEDQGLVELAGQAAGHPGMLTTADGSLLHKQSLPQEVSFYEAVQARHLATADPLAPFLPAYYGQRPSSTISQGDNTANEQQSTGTTTIVIANALHGLRHPSVLDVKMATQQYEDDASEAKKQRLTERARDTTSTRFGFRVAGMLLRVGAADSVRVEKPEAYRITPALCPAYLRRFLPDPTTAADGFGDALLGWIIRDLYALHAALEGRDVYFIGASLLLVYEGNVTTANERWAEYLAAGPAERPAVEATLYRFNVIDFGHSYWAANPTLLADFRFGLRNLAATLEQIRAGHSFNMESILRD
ncbi:hypothetical protein IWQ60_001576 [Tieghemiomyces parasiticus]|uniref:Kinase n=1 Tax=Tieghemiomyces parasiticus TaxID=78921 RepID=A0A9W8AGT3_9FUNG|nr:hypothetical protein IWQ60_001576 [Tieghemiomyces parasiticus]